MASLHAGKFTVGNKQDRLARIGKIVSQVSGVEGVSPSTAASIHGLLNFASGFTLGKALQTSAHGFSMLSSGIALEKHAARALCEHTLIILETLEPREVALPVQSVPVIIYTDGAFGGTNATWGAIVIDPLTGVRLCFAGAVPEFLLTAWKHLVGEQLICQIDMYAVVCVRWKVRYLLYKRRLLLFIDNEPRRISLVKGRSPSDPLFRMSHACACKEASMPCYVWYERIASHSNPADLPSRERAREACDRRCLNFEGGIHSLASGIVNSFGRRCAFPETFKG